MAQNKRSRGWFQRLAAFAGAAVVTSFLTVALVVALTPAVPTAYVNGVEFRVMGDGSVQALVSVAVQGVDAPKDKLTDISLPMQYNPAYMVPSHWDTNEALKSSDTEANWTGPSDDLTHLFFHVDEELYQVPDSNDPTKLISEDPFVWGTDTNRSKMLLTVAGKQNALNFELYLDDHLPESGHIGKVEGNTDNPTLNSMNYFKPGEGESAVVLGTLSFRVNEDNLPELLKKIFSGTTGVADDGTLLLKRAEGVTWTMDYLELKEGRNGNTVRKMQLRDEPDKPTSPIDALFNFEFVDSIQTAEAVRKDVTINAYQAYTNGDVSDLAQAMQNYADSIRLTRMSGKMEDVSMRWGDPAGRGMEFTTGGETYRLTWTASGYTLEHLNAAATPAFELGTWNNTAKCFDFPSDHTYTYDPKAGAYTIRQYYTYTETSVLNGKPVQKTFPTPVTATLTVTPVELVDVVVEADTRTYSNKVGEIPYTYGGLELAEEAKLTVNATPGGAVTALDGFVPTMPVSWNPATIENVKAMDNTAVPPVELRHWPTTDPDVTNRVGLEIPNTNTVHLAEYPFTTGVKKTDIAASYPWLTIPSAAKETYKFQSTRRIADDDPTASGLSADNFELRAYTDLYGYLHIEIARKNAQGAYCNMDGPNAVDSRIEETYTLERLMQSNGTAIQAKGDGETTGIAGAAENWFTASGSFSIQKADISWARNSGGSACQGFLITIQTNAWKDSNSFADERASLQQNINLGGWFSAVLTKTYTKDSNPVDDKQTTDVITGYSAPRLNLYTKSYILHEEETSSDTTHEKLFSFTGNRAGLLRVYPDTGLSTLVTLPDVDTDPDSGESEATNWVETTYDPDTGVEHGYLRQFKVGQWSYVNNGTETTIPGGTLSAGTWTYGEAHTDTNSPKAGEQFAESYIYSGYGQIQNIADEDRKITKKEVKVAVSTQPDNAPNTGLGLKLTYEQFGDTVTLHPDSQVKRVIFDTRRQDYTWQQVVTLTLTNTGTEELHGLYIDGLDQFKKGKTLAEAEAADNGPGSCFTILTQPAPNLAVGASTTFQISYVPNLAKGNYVDVDLYVKNDTGNTLKTFEAQLGVTDSSNYRVTLIVRPTSLSMGTAGFVTGVSSNGSGSSSQLTYNDAPMGATYAPGDRVWIKTTPVDEYAIVPKGVYYVSTQKETTVTDPWKDADGNVIQDLDGNDLYKNYLTLYDPTNPPLQNPYDVDAGEELYYFKMPDRNVTVYVDYFEPLTSKLRLSDLHAYAWQHKANTGVALPWTEDYEEPLREVESGHYRPVLFDSQDDMYVVFLEQGDLTCGVDLLLRELELHENAFGDNWNKDIKPTVEMHLEDSAGSSLYKGTGNTEDTGSPNVSTDVMYHHRSNYFAAPSKPGEYKTVLITISYNDTADKWPTGVEGLKTREYRVRFIMSPGEEALHTANAGNSPYGMIMNDATIDGVVKDANGKTAKDRAKAAYDANNRFTFSKTDGLTPKKASSDDGNVSLLTNIYWPEAWRGGVNYDKDETALFAYIGQPFYEPGVQKITNTAGFLYSGTLDITLEYTRLDTASGTTGNLADRFVGLTVNGTTKNTIVLVTGATVKDGVLDGRLIEATFSDYKDVRPGVYKLTYTFHDYFDVDNTDPSNPVDEEKTISFTRPFIILSPHGDGDVKLQVATGHLAVTAADEAVIRDRYTTKGYLPIDESRSYTDYSDADRLVYRYRILDANNDRNINNVDADYIQQLLLTGNVTEVTLPEFYRPVDYINPPPVTTP